MDKNEKSVTNTQEKSAEIPPQKELTAEEKLAERERVLAEREKAFEASMLKSKAVDTLKAKNIPAELADFLNYESEETMTAGIEKLAEIIGRHRAKSNPTGMTAVLGSQHGNAISSNNNDSFLNGFNV